MVERIDILVIALYMEPPTKDAAATTGHDGVAVFVSGKAHFQERRKVEPVVGNSSPQENLGGVESTTINSSPRTDYRTATATKLDSTAVTSTATSRGGVHSESSIRHREEEDSNGDNHVDNARPDAGCNALLVLEEAAVLPIANINEDGLQVADRLWKGETEK